MRWRGGKGLNHPPTRTFKDYTNLLPRSYCLTATEMQRPYDRQAVEGLGTRRLAVQGLGTRLGPYVHSKHFLLPSTLEVIYISKIITRAFRIREFFGIKVFSPVFVFFCLFPKGIEQFLKVIGKGVSRKHLEQDRNRKNGPTWRSVVED